MDSSKAFAPKTAPSNLSNPSGLSSLLPSSASPNVFSAIDNYVMNHSDGKQVGFVSVGDEFEKALDSSTTFFGMNPQNPVEGGARTDSAFVDSVSRNDDDDKFFVAESKVGVLDEDKVIPGEDKDPGVIWSEGFKEENGIGAIDGEGKEVEGIELKDGEVVEGKKTEVYGGDAEVGELVERKYLGDENGNVESGTVEPEKSQSVETDGVNFTSGDDSVVEAIRVDVLSSGVNVVGDVEKGKGFENEGMEAPEIEGGAFRGGKFLEGEKPEVYGGELEVSKVASESKIFGDENGNVESGILESEKSELIETDVNFTSGGDSVVETVYVDFSSSGVAVVGDVKEVKDLEIIEMGAPSVSVDNGFDKLSSDVGDSVNVGNVYGKEGLVTEEKPEGSVEPNHIKPAMEIATDGLDFVVNDKVDGGDGVKTLQSDSIAETMQTNPANEMEHLENNQTFVSTMGQKLGSEKSKLPVSTNEFQVEEKNNPDEDGENEGSVIDGETDGKIFGNSEAAKQFLEELERRSPVGSHSGAESSRNLLQRIDGQIVTDSDEEVETDEEGEEKEMFDSSALAALLKAATGLDTDGGTVTVTSQDGSRLFSVERPAGLGSALRSVRAAPRPSRPNLFTGSSLTTSGDTDINLSEEEKKKLENLQQLRVKFLRLVHRLGHSSEESVAAQVLYRLALLAGRQTNQLFSLDAAKRIALQLEAEGKDDLNFSLNILVLGKTGVGKSATVNSIFGEERSVINAFEPATSSVKEITGIVNGVKIRVIDTPGLKSSGSEQGANRKVLSSVKRFMKKCPPDIVLYVDRLDSQTRDLNDLPLLKSITSVLGSSIWRSAIVTLTHAASAPPDGPSGSPLSYEVFVAQRSHVVQQSIGQAVGDLRLMNPSLMNPVSLVENHLSCRKNREGQKVLPNGQAWKPQLLLLCYSMKILSEASSLSKSQDSLDHRKLFGFRSRSPPLPYLLSWLLQSRTHPKLSNDQGGDNVDSDVDLADLSDEDEYEEDDEYDQLPPFKPLRKTQLAKLSREQKKAYFEEYDYRVKLLQKKQWREELRRMKEMKKKGKVATDDYNYTGEEDPENEGPAAVPVPLPDMVLPPSFDSDNPAYRYRFLEPTSQFLARPVLDTHGWDHDCGYDGVNLENTLAIASRFPAAVAIQLTKDKKEFNIHLDSSVSAKHGDNGSSMAGFDIQNVGKQLAYILRGETKFKNFKNNKTAAGISVTFLGENVATGFKLEDQIALGKRLMLVGSTGTVRSQSDSAYGANLEVRLREADYPIGQDQSSLGLSLVKWRGDLALGANLQSQFSLGRSSKVAVRAGLNNKMSGQITVRTSSSEQLQIALLGLLPIATAIYKSIRPGVSENYSMY